MHIAYSNSIAYTSAELNMFHNQVLHALFVFPLIGSTLSHYVATRALVSNGTDPDPRALLSNALETLRLSSTNVSQITGVTYVGSG
jgi:uncharacterized protein YPO0396